MMAGAHATTLGQEVEATRVIRQSSKARCGWSVSYQPWTSTSGLSHEREMNLLLLKPCYFGFSVTHNQTWSQPTNCRVPECFGPCA